MIDSSALYVYGNCMNGWIYSIMVSPLADIEDDYELAENHMCTTSTECQLCPETYAVGCLEEDFDFQADIIEEWDTLTSITFPTTLTALKSTDFNLVRNTDRTGWPTFITGVGLLTGTNVWSYINTDDNSAHYYFPFPPRFVIEAWIKFDLNYTATDSTLMTIFGKFTGADPTSTTSANRQMKVGFAVANHFMRVYVNSKYYDLDYDFIENHKW